MTPRPYQIEAEAAVFEEFKDRDSTLVVMPTGTGKTVLFGGIAHRWDDRRILVLAHREELIFQTARTVKAITGEEPAIEMADYRSDETGVFGKARVVIGSVQSMCRESRLNKFDRDGFGLVVTDEAHHDVPQCKTYKAIRDYFATAKKLGVTATPDRGDKLAMKQSYQSVAYELALPDAIDQGWLVPIRQKFVEIAGLDFSHVRTTAGDLNQGDLDQLMGEPSKCHEVAAAVAETASGRKTLVFCVSVAHARKVADILNRIPGRKAEALVGEDDKVRRRDVLNKYRAGELTDLVGCGIFTEGFDESTIEVVFIARPTKSRALYTQMVGRGTRTLTDVLTHDMNAQPSDIRRAAIASSRKPFIEVIDFVGNSGKHQLITTADILGGRYAPAAVTRAKRNLAKRGGTGDTQQALQEAKSELEREKERHLREQAEAIARVEQRRRQLEEHRRRGMYGKAQLHSREVNPFGGDYVPEQKGFGRGGLTDKQSAILVKNGYDPNSMSAADAIRTLNELFAAWKGQGITPKQRQTLAKFGEAGEINRDKAAMLFAVIKARGWQRRDSLMTKDRLYIKPIEGRFAPAFSDPEAGDVILDRTFRTVDEARAFLSNVVEQPLAV